VAGGRRSASEASECTPNAVHITFVILKTPSLPFFFSAEKGGRGWVRSSRGDFILGLK
jgi:hypothetical protein